MMGNVSVGTDAILVERVKHLEELLAEKERLIKVYEKLVEGKNEIYSWNNMSYYFFTVMCLQ